MKAVSTIILVAFLIQAAFAASSTQKLKLRVGQVSQSAGSTDTSSAIASYLSSASASASQALSNSLASAAAASQEQIPATELVGQSSSACASGSCSGNPISFGSTSTDDSLTIDEAVKPVDEWIKDFKSRTEGSADILEAARSTVRPLIDRLKRNQQAAVDKLIDSNQDILQRVEETVTEHVYNLLRAERIKEDKDAEVETVKEKLQEAKDAAAEKQEEAKVLSSTATAASKSASAASKSVSSLSESSESLSGSSSF